MVSLKNKLPLGLFALCAVSIVGMKDTGVFINEHVQKTYSGSEIEFSIGEKVEILENKGNEYYIQKGKAKVTVPQEKILLTDEEDNIKLLIQTTNEEVKLYKEIKDKYKSNNFKDDEKVIIRYFEILKEF